MKTLEQQTAAYLRYHRDARNKLTHFVGVPLIIFALLIPMSCLAVDVAGVRVTRAHAFLVLVLGYYFLMDVPIALALTVVAAALLRAAQWTAGHRASAGWLVSPALSAPAGRCSCWATITRASAPRCSITSGRSS